MTKPWRWVMAMALCLVAGAAAGAQAPIAQPHNVQPPQSLRQAQTLRSDLLGYLRTTPTLAEALAADPSLLADAAYIGRSNPALAQFLSAHAEVARNPDYYLFADLGPGQPGDALQRRLWPARSDSTGPALRVWDDTLPFLVFLVIVGAILWILRTLLDNRRWGRWAQARTEAHSRLLEKFGSSQELLAYMETDAGRHFLESASLAGGAPEAAPQGLLGRVLWSLQLGLVLGLVGAGLLFLVRSVPEAAAGLRICGILGLMAGIGFILSALGSFAMAKHLDLLPDKAGRD